MAGHGEAGQDELGMPRGGAHLKASVYTVEIELLANSVLIVEALMIAVVLSLIVNFVCICAANLLQAACVLVLIFFQR